MCDVLDININSSTEFESDEVGDKGIKHLKLSASKRKGRGLDQKPFQGYKKHRSESENKSFPSWQSYGVENWDESPDEPMPLESPRVIKTKYIFQDLEDCVPQKSIEGWGVFVSGVHEEATEDDLSDKFSEIAPVKSVRTNLDRRTGFMKSYAIIEYHNYEDARRAIETYDETEFLGIKMKVFWCFLKGPNKKYVDKTKYK